MIFATDNLYFVWANQVARSSSIIAGRRDSTISTYTTLNNTIIQYNIYTMFQV